MTEKITCKSCGDPHGPWYELIWGEDVCFVCYAMFVSAAKHCERDRLAKGR